MVSVAVEAAVAVVVVMSPEPLRRSRALRPLRPMQSVRVTVIGEGIVSDTTARSVMTVIVRSVRVSRRVRPRPVKLGAETPCAKVGIAIETVAMVTGMRPAMSRSICRASLVKVNSSVATSRTQWPLCSRRRIVR